MLRSTSFTNRDPSATSQAPTSNIPSSSRRPTALPAINAPKPAPSKAPQPTVAAGSIQLAAQEPAPKEQVAPTEVGETIDLTSPSPAFTVPAPRGETAPPKRIIEFKAKHLPARGKGLSARGTGLSA